MTTHAGRTVLFDIPRAAAAAMCFVFVSADAGFAQGDAAFVLPADVQSVLTSRCVDCHGVDTAEADVRLDSVGALKLDARLELLNKVQDQLFYHTMPPADATQPVAVHVEELLVKQRPRLF